jgi:hypothetical protein
VTPVFYQYMERLQQWMRGGQAAQAAAVATEAGEMTTAR